MAWGAERPESALGESVASPLVVSCEIDVLPAERGEEFEQFGVDSEAAPSRSSDGPLDINGIPERDCGCDECEAAGPIALLLEAAIPDLSQAAEEDGSCESVASFAFVEASVNAPPEFYTLQPREDEQGSFDSAQFTESHREPILARVAAEFAKHERGRHRALLDRNGKAEDLVPVGSDRLEIDRAANHGYQSLVL